MTRGTLNVNLSPNFSADKNKDFSKMIRKFLPALFCLYASYGYTASIDTLKADINSIIADKQATVGISMIGQDSEESISIDGDKHLPMQSVYKYHLSIAVLNLVDQGQFSLDDKITITPDDLDNGLWSPIRKLYPNGAELTLAEVIQHTVAGSDNVGCDMLFEMIGGPKVAHQYFHSIGLTDIAILHEEKLLQSDWSLQYLNWTTANAASQALKMFFENKNNLLSAESHKFLWDTMKSTWTGKKILKGKLPKGTVVAHKTGFSGTNKAGLVAAQNDIGIIFLPNGDYFYLSVLVSDSKESNKTNRAMIADIAKVTWDYFEAQQSEQTQSQEKAE